jgi:nucleoside 2-deoxyribosyltransferase
MSGQMKDSGERQKFTTGAVRDTATGKPRPDLISPHANLREGAWLKLGAEKYKERNWEAGIPISRCIASLARHLESYKLGLRDEDHMAAIRCNAGFILHYEEEIKAGRLDSSLDDMPHYLDRGVTTPLVPGVSRKKVQSKLDADPDTVELLRAQGSIQVRSYNNTTQNTPPWVDAECEAKVQVKLDETFADQQRVDAASEGDAVAVSDPAALLDPKLWTVPFTVYLCGPITGQDVDYLWRQAATAVFQQNGIKVLDPLRGKHRDQIGGLGLSYKGQLAAPEIADRDQMDVQEADVILAHFPYDPPRQSIGSLMEIGAAAIGYGKPVVLCTEVKVFNDHLFCRNFCTLEPDFEQALNRIVAMATAKRR